MEEQLTTSEELDSQLLLSSSTPLPKQSCPSSCWGELPRNNKTRLFPEETGGFFSSATYSWIFPLLSLGIVSQFFNSHANSFAVGNKRPLEMEDLPEIHWTTAAADVFESHLKKHIEGRLGGTDQSEPTESPVEDVDAGDRPLLNSRVRRSSANKEPARRLNLWLVIARFITIHMVSIILFSRFLSALSPNI